jgi:membrane-bound serine protease (ClpP class)
MTWPIVLLIAAAAFMLLEVMIPSFGMLGLLSATAYVFAVVLAFKLSPADGFVVAGVGLVILPAAFLLGFRLVRKTPLGRKTLLEGPAADSIQRGSTAQHQLVLGKSGVALTDLRPTGVAEIAGVRTDVTAATGFVPKHTPVTVVSVDGTRIVVEPAPDTTEPKKDHAP